MQDPLSETCASKLHVIDVVSTPVGYSITDFCPNLLPNLILLSDVIHSRQVQCSASVLTPAQTLLTPLKLIRKQANALSCVLGMRSSIR